MKYIKTFFRFIFWNIWLIGLRKKTSKNIKDDDQIVSKISSILHNTIKKRLNVEDKIWVNNIEKLRKELKQDHSEIIVTDFGAGNPKSNRSGSQMHIGQVNSSTISQINIASKSPFWSLLLFNIISEYKPKIALELGTCLGISAAYQTAALTIYSGGKLITMEGSAALVEKSRQHFTYLGLLNVEIVEGRFSDNLKNVLEQNQPIDYVFIDGHHDHDSTINYFETILPFLSEKAIVIFDDISWSKGMKSAWKKIIKNQNLKIIFDLRSIGICFLDNQRSNQRMIKF